MTQLHDKELHTVAQTMMDDVLNLQGSVGAIATNQSEVHKSLHSLQRKVSMLLCSTDDAGRRFDLASLVSLVTKLERGETAGIDKRELEKALIAMDMGAAKIRNYLKKQGGAHVGLAATAA